MKNIVPRRRIVPGWPAFSTWVILVLWLFPCGLASAQFLYTTNSGTITITGYDGPGGWVIVPDTIGGLPVSSIADAAKGWRIEELHTEEGRLDEVFRNITMPDTAAEAGAKAS